MSKSLIFDIETDNLLLDVTKFWVGVTYCIETKEEKVYYDPTELVYDLSCATLLVGHNIIGYDLPVLDKLTGIRLAVPVVDTLILAKLAYYDKDKGWSHSLDSYGERLGYKKGKYDDWSKYTKEMEEYCKRDVQVTKKLYTHLKRKTTWLPETALQLEQDVQKIVTKQYMRGWKFDEEKARALHIELVEEKEVAEAALFETFKPKFLPDGKVKTPKRPFRRMGVSTVGPHQPIKLRTFNPGSGNHVVWWVERVLGKQKWLLTDKGNPKTDADTLQLMFGAEEFLTPLLHYLEVNKLLGQLAEGNLAWLKLVREDGRLHGQNDILGTVTGRASSSRPNMSQVPSVRAYKGAEARELFTVPNDKILVAADLSGVELRCLAHYMARYDGGRYSKILLEGDIHTANQEAAGLPTRDIAKTFAYSTLYGAGDAKIGTLVGGGTKEGKKLRAAFEDNTPGYRQLTEGVKSAAKKKWIKSITGRRLFIRSPHSALNTLLQNMGASIAKVWMVEVDRRIQEEGVDAVQINWTHDELEFECSEEDSEKLMKILEESSIKAGNILGSRTIIESEAQKGRTWKDVH